MIAPELLKILCCPVCHADLREEGDRLVCGNPQCGRRYPVQDGIPVLLAEAAELPDAKK